LVPLTKPLWASQLQPRIEERPRPTALTSNRRPGGEQIGSAEILRALERDPAASATAS
jgi:hypothetical protein